MFGKKPSGLEFDRPEVLICAAHEAGNDHPIVSAENRHGLSGTANKPNTGRQNEVNPVATPPRFHERGEAGN